MPTQAKRILSTFPKRPFHCRDTPTEWRPFLVIPLSSINRAVSAVPPSNASASRAT